MKIVIDTETTGLDPQNDELLQVSIIDTDGTVLFDSMFRPEKHEKWEAAEMVNGINPEMVKDASSISDKKDEISTIIQKSGTVIGYNTSFDISFLVESGISFPDTFEVVDVMRDFAPIYGQWSNEKQDFKWQKLTKAAEYYGYDWGSHPEGAHNSLGDCFATLHVYNGIKEQELAAQKKARESGTTDREISKRKYSKVKKSR